jgi:putative ABC transport system substrate-binding protein
MRPMMPTPLRVAAFAAAFAALPAATQSPARLPTVGVVLPFEKPAIDAKSIPVQRPLEEGLRDLGWVDGRNVRILWRPKESIDELVRLPVDVIVAFGNPILETQATSTIPIVAHMQHSVEQSTASGRPSPNVTGISVEAGPDLAQKRLQLLKEATGIKRVARFYVGAPLRVGTLDELAPEYGVAARALDLEVFPVWVQGPEDVPAAFREIARRGNVGISFGSFRRSLPGMEATWDSLMAQVSRHRIPAIFDIPQAADEGALMGFGVDIPQRSRRLAHYVDRILKGARPVDLPIEQPVSVELVVNLRAAESIGVKIPDTVLLRADRVIR